MAERPIKDIEIRHELAVGQQIIDPRPVTEKFAEWLSVPINLLLVVVPVAVITAIAPVLGFVTLPALAIMTAMHVSTRSTLPIRYPADAVDQNGKPGSGILYIGQVASSSAFENFKEIWLSDDDLRKHALILGSTGSGKSEALKSIFFNALNWSSGFFIADGKADNKLPTDVYTMVRANGRDADMLVLNFLLAGKTPEQVRRSRRRRTNKLNPFPPADADTIIQMGANLLPKVEGDAKNWQEKALNLWRSVVAAVCYKRDTQGFDVSVATFIDYMSLHKVEELYLEGYQEALDRNGEWSYGFAGVKNYLESGCPSYQVNKLLKKHGFSDEAEEERGRPGGFGKRGAGKEFEQDSMAYEQHSYRTNQLMPVLNLLDKTYGFIFRDKYPEIDMSDVTLRNRILVMLIPSLEKSAAEAENLGKLAIACLRVMMSKNLGAEVEGSHEELLGSKATNSPYPYVVALDELAYYFSDGIAVMFAQARSLGTCMIAAAQDLEKLTEGSKGPEAGAMLANQVTKFFMRIDDTGKTAEMVQKVVGKATVAVRRSFRYNELGYARRNEVEVTEVERVSPQRLKRFKVGEGIVDAMGRTHYMRWFYMGDDIEAHRVDCYTINRFLQVAPPSDEDIAANSIAVDDFNDPFRKGQELSRKLRQDMAVQLRVRPDPVFEAVARAGEGLSPHLGAETRGIVLYMAARTRLLELEARGAADSGPSQQGAVTHKQAPLQSDGNDGFVDAAAPASGRPAPARQEPPAARAAPAGTPAPAASRQPLRLEPDDEVDEDFLDDNPLSGVLGTPFERKPAEEVLGLPKAAVPAAGDPMDAVLAGAGEVMLDEDIRLHGQLLIRLAAVPEAADPVTGLSLVPKDDNWVAGALEEATKMLEMPRSSDNTVVGLTGETLQQVERVEELMQSPAPDQAARVLERVVAVRVTPETTPRESASDDSLDAFFSTLKDKVNR